MKQRILFVEDSPVLAAAYAQILEGEAERWEVVTALDAEQGLRLMAQTPFDVVVSDLGLPGMNGIEFINEVKHRYPGCSRIVLSGISEKQEVVRCLNATHQFLVKPLTAKALKGTLARIGALDAYLGDKSLRALVGQVGTLPSFPSLYVEVMKELESDEPSVERIATAMLRDPGMTAKLLQVANSAAFGLGRELNNPFEAIQFLGLRTLRSLALSAHVFSCFSQNRMKSFSIDALWTHSIRTAAVAQRLMQLEGAEPAQVEEAYIAGMLHDTGKLLLADSLPREFQRALGLAASRPVPFHEAEIDVFGANHSGVAAYLFGLWGLPATIVEAVAFHHTPSKGHADGFGPLTAVHVANVFEHGLSPGASGPGQVQGDESYLSGLGLWERMELWRAAAEEVAGQAV